VAKQFTVWTPCLVLFDRFWSCLIKIEDHQTFGQKLKLFLLFSCFMGDVRFVRLNSRVANMFEAGMRIALVQLLV